MGQKVEKHRIGKVNCGRVAIGLTFLVLHYTKRGVRLTLI